MKNNESLICMIKNLAERNSVVHSADVRVLIAALEEKDQRIAELEVTQMTGPLALVLKRNVELERITEGVTQDEIAGGWTARRLSEYAKSLERRLQQPIKLPDELFIKISGQAVSVMSTRTVKEKIRAAGFKTEVEGA
ncbi:hypothetical protein [Serratia fonticola]|uniref:hypothetical protein n=1 Tax=Serratia fonticola TaxID=47917 RepID=UPI0015C5C14E|nr:hypothetical protein [Serratia fonticola]NYA15729.1 hypothetical protein [Serratia fonticola]NYA35849.1 hypothetical protein [Serratia fonticola]